MLIAVPYFGDLARFRPLLDLWFFAYKAAGLDVRDVILLTDGNVEAAARAYGCGIARVDLAGFEDLVRPAQPFDVKGAIVCAYLLEHDYPTLVIDSDAVLLRDPRPTIEPYRNRVVGMSVDQGALVHYRRSHLDAPFAHVRKMCAGVMYFGASPGRGRLVAGYRRAFEEMKDSLPWTPALSHLLEQYAWSVASHRRGGAVLPGSMNWSTRMLGACAFAVVDHDYGHGKWGDLRVKAPENS